MPPLPSGAPVPHHHLPSVMLVTVACCMGFLETSASDRPLPGRVSLAWVARSNTPPRLEPTPPAGAPLRSSPAFDAVTHRLWPAGLVPVFEVEKSGRFEYRRLPPRGQENHSDPVCFILPPRHEPEAAGIAGTWEIRATSARGPRHVTRLDLAVDGPRVTGRLDQGSDYRFAWVTTGTWLSNRVTLDVEYIQDRYQLTATLEHGGLAGTWRHHEDADHGTWTGTRPDPGNAAGVPPVGRAVDLVIWESPEGAVGSLPGLVDRPPGPGWKAGSSPLGRAWPPEPTPTGLPKGGRPK